MWGFWIGLKKLRLYPGLRTWPFYGTGDMASGSEGGRWLTPSPLNSWQATSDRMTALITGPAGGCLPLSPAITALACTFPVPVSPFLSPAPGFLPVSLRPSLGSSASPCLLPPIPVSVPVLPFLRVVIDCFSLP